MHVLVHLTTVNYALTFILLNLVALHVCPTRKLVVYGNGWL